MNNKFALSTKSFFKKNGSTILTVIGCIGVTATAIMSARDTPKANKLIKLAKENDDEREFTTFEKIKIAAPAYIPTAAVGLSTILCVTGANIANKRNQAVLLSAYALIDNAYKEYKNKTAELYGKDADTKIMRKVSENRIVNNIKTTHDGEMLFFDNNTLKFFTSTMDDVTDAEMVMNEIVSSKGHISVHEFYDMLGIPAPIESEGFGWSAISLRETKEQQIVFNYEMAETSGGVKYCMLTSNVDPTLDYLYM